MKRIALLLLLATCPLLAQSKKDDLEPPSLTQERLWVLYGQAVAETRLQQEYIGTLQQKIIQLQAKIDELEKIKP